MARSSADSRVRWATRIENVLWMLNVATTRAMPAKARRIISNMPRKSSPISCSCSAVSSACVSASMRAGSSCGDLVAQRLLADAVLGGRRAPPRCVSGRWANSSRRPRAG